MKHSFVTITRSVAFILLALALIVGVIGLIGARKAQAAGSLFISEVAPWSSGNGPLNADWFEVTNTSASAVNITGWKMDDSSGSFGSAVALNGVASIAAGESVIFIESGSPATIVPAFKTLWFGASPPAGLQIGTYNGSGVGLSNSSDAVNLFNSSGVLQANVSFGASPAGPSFPTFDNANGLNNTSISQLSAAGVNGAFVAANDANEIGSLGTIGGSAPTITGLAAGASGVFGDSTTPIFSGANGFPFTVSDVETPPGSLTVTISNSAPSLVTATLATVNAAAGQYRLDFGAPASASGIAAITVTVTDGNSQQRAATFQYGVSNYDATRPNARYHTGASDASAAYAIDANYMIVANDEDQVLRVYDRNNSGAPAAQTDVTSLLNLTDIDGGIPREVDIEASAFDGSKVFFIGSHDNHSGGNARPNRSRLFAVTVSGTGAATSLTFNGYYQYLKSDLIAWDNANGHGLGAGYLGLAASAAAGVIPELPNGFNIEGLTFAPGSSTTLYVGFRAPLEPTSARTKGMIVPVTNGGSLLGAPSGSAVFGAPMLFDLGGRGIRSMECNTSGCLIVAGSVDGVENFALYRWTGNPANPPAPITVNLTNGSGYHPGLNPEGMIIPANVNASGAIIQVISDNGDTDWYNNGVIAKDLPITAHKKARSDYITLPIDPTPTPTLTITPTITRTYTLTPTRTNTPITVTVTTVTPVTVSPGTPTRTKTWTPTLTRTYTPMTITVTTVTPITVSPGTPTRIKTWTPTLTPTITPTGPTFTPTRTPTPGPCSAVDLTKGPNLVFTGDNTRMRVAWQWSTNTTFQMQWGADTTYSLGNAPVTAYDTANYLYKYDISNLTPGTKYYYRAVVGTQCSGGTFYAAPPSSATSVKFFDFGDTQEISMHEAQAAQINTIWAADPAFQTIQLHSGDWVNSDDESEWLTTWFNRSYPNIQIKSANMPVTGAPGNHEAGGVYWQRYFPQPFQTGGRYRSFDYGPMHVVTLDLTVSEDGVLSPAELAWFTADLAASTKMWKFVVFHAPGYSAGGSHPNSAYVQNTIQPLCAQYGVSIVFNGHNHYYSRAVVNGVTHLTIGGGGGGQNTPETGYPGVVFTATVHPFGQFTIVGNTLTARIVDNLGNTVETFTIVR
jgi:hypothetical protein